MSDSTEARNTVPDAVFAAVAECVAESLAVDASEVKLESRLIDDLGADSLDFVDIIFMLEQKLDVKMRETELNVLTRLDFSSPEVMREGFLTDEVVQKLSGWLPAIRAAEDKSAITPGQMFSFITIEAICLAATQQGSAEA